MSVSKLNDGHIIVENWTGKTLELFNGIIWPCAGNITLTVHRHRITGSYMSVPISVGTKYLSLPVQQDNVLLAVNQDIPIRRNDLVYPMLNSAGEVVEFLMFDDLEG